MSARIYLALAATLVVAVSTPAQKGRIRDAILQNDGSRIRGIEVTEMTAAFVVFKKGSKEDKVAADKVQEVLWHSPPDSFMKGRAEESKGSHQAAADYYLEAVGGTKRKPLQEEAMFRGARAQLEAAEGDGTKIEAAAAKLKEYMTTAPKGFRVPEARLLLGKALRLQGKSAEAETTLKALEDAAMAEGWGPRWDAKAKFERARALMDQGKASQARSAYQSVVNTIRAIESRGTAPAEMIALRTRSVVGEGETYVADKKFDQALRFFRQHARPAAPGQPTTLQAAALAGEGEALLLAHGTDTRKLREAQTALAKAQILDTDNSDTTAKALYLSGKVLLALGDNAKTGTARARTYFDLVLRHYATSPWAKKARAEVGGD